MDDAAYRLLHEHFDPDSLDPQLDDVPDSRPDLPAAVLLRILDGYRDQDLAHVLGTGAPPEISPLEALCAARLLVADLTGCYGWLVRDARAAGASWSQIGAALGMSKQSAWGTYRDADAAPPGQAAGRSDDQEAAS